MKISDYKKKPLSERKQIVTEPVGINDSISIERLKTAIKHSSPLAVSFSKELVEEYWTLKKSAS